MNNRTLPPILQNIDSEVAGLISKSRNISDMDALRLFLDSKTHEMLSDNALRLWHFSPLAILIYGNRSKLPVIREILCIYGVMKLSKEFRFFTYLLESYAQHKNTTAGAVLKTLDEKGLTDFVYKMYDLYHVEAIENAYMDLDSLIATGKPAW